MLQTKRNEHNQNNSNCADNLLQPCDRNQNDLSHNGYGHVRNVVECRTVFLQVEVVHPSSCDWIIRARYWEYSHSDVDVTILPQYSGKTEGVTSWNSGRKTGGQRFRSLGCGSKFKSTHACRSSSLGQLSFVWRSSRSPLQDKVIWTLFLVGCTETNLVAPYSTCVHGSN